MTGFKELWWDKQREKFPGKTDDEIRDMFRQWSNKGKKVGKGGFYKNPDLAREAGEKRWQKHEKEESSS